MLKIAGIISNIHSLTSDRIIKREKLGIDLLNFCAIIITKLLTRCYLNVNPGRRFQAPDGDTYKAAAVLKFSAG